MSKTITISDTAAAELVAALLGQPAQYVPPVQVQPVQQPVQSQPIVQPVQTASGGSIYDIGRQAGFDQVLVVPWDWGRQDKITLDTSALGGIGLNGILVVPFIATGPEDNNNLAMITATGYPAPNMMNNLTLALSDTPCMLSTPVPGTSEDKTPAVVYGVGKVNPVHWSRPNEPGAVSLVPGKQYFINVAGRGGVSAANPYGVSTVTPGAINYPLSDFRLEAQKPAGH